MKVERIEEHITKDTIVTIDLDYDEMREIVCHALPENDGLTQAAKELLAVPARTGRRLVESRITLVFTEEATE